MKFSVLVICVVLVILFSKGFSYSLPKNVATAVKLTKKNSTCLEVQSTKECRSCTSHEKKFWKICGETGNIEEIICKKPKTTLHESCPFAFKAELQRFWVFEGCFAGLAILSNIVVWWRRNALDVVKYHRLKRQISDIF